MNKNNTPQIDASLIEAWNDVECLPDRNEWLQEPRSEAAQSQYAFLLLKRHFVRAGVPLKREDVPTTWTGWSWIFYLNIDEFVSHKEHPEMLRGFLSEIVDYTQAVSPEFFANQLLQMFEPFIDRDPPRSKFLPLLPVLALEQMNEMHRMLQDQHDDDMTRMDTMSY